MSAIPISYVTSMAVHKELDKREQFDWKQAEMPSWTPTLEQTSVRNVPMKYNGKLMKSIWGMYNHYAPPSFQKNFESKEVVASNSGPLVG